MEIVWWMRMWNGWRYCWVRLLSCTCLQLYLLAYLLTPWSRVLLENVTGSQLVKFSAFYGTRRFITAFTSARHLYLSWASLIRSIPQHPTHWRSILILSSHLHLGLPSGSFLQVYLPRPCICLSYHPYALHVPPISFFSILSPGEYWVRRPATVFRLFINSPHLRSFAWRIAA